MLQDAEAKLRTPPVTLKVTEFSMKKGMGEKWFSPPLYTHKGGYKCASKVSARGRDGDEDHAAL